MVKNKKPCFEFTTNNYIMFYFYQRIKNNIEIIQKNVI